jgi:GWxTD domain-containing protein
MLRKTFRNCFFLFLIAGCSTEKNPFVQNRADAFRFPQEKPAVDVHYWAIDADSIAIRLQVPTAQLGLLPDAAGLEPRRRALIRAAFYPQFKRKDPVRSPPVLLHSGIRDTAVFLHTELHLQFLSGTSGLLVLEVTDLQKKKNRIIYVNLNRVKNIPSLDFQVKSTGKKEDPYWTRIGSNCSIQFRDPTEDQFVLEHYPLTFPMPLPPFVVNTDAYRFPEQPFRDTLNREQLLHFSPGKQEFLRISSRINPEVFTTLAVFNETFPRVSQEEERFRALVYLMQKSELNALVSERKTTSGVSDFWGMIGLDRSQAQEVERLWFARVEEANSLFSTFNPGWQTDRGMIYTIFGAPSSVYNNGRAEEWTYPAKAGMLPLSFRFERFSHAFSSDDYRLERKTTYASVWYKAIESWRNGNAYFYE